MMNRTLVLTVAGVAVVAMLTGAIAFYYAPSPNVPEQGGLLIEFTRTGGIAGVDDIFVVRNDGSATLTSRYGASFNATVGKVELSELKNVIATNLDRISPKTFQAKPGAADYFGYHLKVTTVKGTTQIVWVDQWAVSGDFPEGLKAIQGELQKLLTDLTVHHSFVNVGSSQAGGLRISFLTDKLSYKGGEQVNFAVILENTGSANVTYTSPTPCHPDVRLTLSNGTISDDVTTTDGAICVQVLQGRVLQGNTYLVQTGSWQGYMVNGSNQIPVSPGMYTISAVFPYASFEKELVSCSVKISISS